MKKYTAIWKKRIHPFYGWLVIAVVAGMAMGVTFVVRSDAFQTSMAAGVSVSVTSPVNCAGACSVSAVSPVHIVASASSGKPITGWQVYVDGIDNSSATSVTSINTYLGMAAGTHAVLVRAWDSTGAYGTVALTVNVVHSGVTITSPASGATGSSPVHFAATGQSGYPITAWAVYDDGNHGNALLYKGGSGTAFDQSINMTAGSRSGVTVQFWDNSGAVSKAQISFTVKSAADTTPPSVPSGLTVSAVSSSQINLAWTASTDNVGVTGYNVYKNGAKLGTTANTSYSATGLSAGTAYSFTVAAYDAAGNISSQSTSASATTQSAPAAGVATIPQIQNGAWQTCGNCGNSGATGVTATYAVAQNISSPSLSGSSAQFSINGNGNAFPDGYWYIKRDSLMPNPVKYLSYSFDLYVPSYPTGTIQAIEFENQQVVNGKLYNFAWQANYAGNSWRTFNYASSSWVAASVPFAAFAPNTWHHIVSTFHVDPSTGNGIHDSLAIDGNTYGNLNISYAPSASSGNYLSNGFQLDTNKTGTAYKVYVDNMQIQYSD
jgi:hypothetical protein